MAFGKIFADEIENSSGKVARNVEHLELMAAKDYWTTEDLAPLNVAITAGS